MNIAIAGYGAEGKANYRYYKALGHTLTIVDEREAVDDLPLDAAVNLGPTALDDLRQFDIVIRTPSLPPSKLATAKKIWSGTNEFFARCPAPIIGVTGTKGKGTTCSLVAAILKNTGKTVHLVGNIGLPALEVLDKVQKGDIVIYELSSFQLWDTEISPHIAVVLMVEPDHLNVHADFDDYVRAKANIARHQQPNDVVIYHPTDPRSARIAHESVAEHKQRYLTPEAAYVDSKNIIIAQQIICPTSEVGLMGEYNLQNVCAAISACWWITHDREAIAQAARDFKGLEHHLEFVAKKQGVLYYNDSFSSAPTATMGAITAFKTPIILIIGGYDKGVDFAPLAQKIQANEHIKHVLAIGAVRKRLGAALKQAGFHKFELLDAQDMSTIVKRAVSIAQAGDVVLLSPGCASFDMFKNFSQRGQLFQQAVKEL